MRLPVVQWLFSAPAALFYCLATAGLHESLGSPPGLAAVAAILATYLLPSSIALWVLADAQQRRRQLPYDFGSFVFFAWWALVPIYLFSTRGWRGIIPLGWFVLLYLAAALFGNIPSLFLATRQ